MSPRSKEPQQMNQDKMYFDIPQVPHTQNLPNKCIHYIGNKHFISKFYLFISWGIRLIWKFQNYFSKLNNPSLSAPNTADGSRWHNAQWLCFPRMRAVARFSTDTFSLSSYTVILPISSRFCFFNYTEGFPKSNQSWTWI